MSSQIFPTMDPPDWSFTFPLKRTPVYSTIVQTPASGRAELRIALMPHPRWKYDLDLSYAKGEPSDGSSGIGKIVGFYQEMIGCSDDWLFLDPYMNSVPASAPQQFGTGDGTTQSFPLTLNNGTLLNDFGSPSLTVYINGVSQGSPGGGNYNLSNGIVTFTSIPGSGAVIAFSGQFYLRCRFLEDEWDELGEDLYQIWSNRSIKFISLIP